MDGVGNEKNWQGHVGFVTPDMTKATLFKAEEGTVCAMCGPPVMLEKACHPALQEMGYGKTDIFEF